MKPLIWKTKLRYMGRTDLWACAVETYDPNSYTGFGWSPQQAYRSWLLRERFPKMQ